MKWNDYRPEDYLYAHLRVHHRQIDKSREVIKQFLSQCQNPYIACSGGKDSVAMLHLIQSVSQEHYGKLVPVMWHNSGVEWPGTTEVFNRLQDMGLIHHFIEIRSDVDVIRLKQDQYAGKISAKKKDEMALFTPIRRMVKKHGFDGVFMGLRTEESRGRGMNRAVNGLIYQTKEIAKCIPIADWKWQGVYAYIAVNRLPLHPIYSAPLLNLENRGRIRLSWWLSTDYRCHGEMVWVRMNFPGIYRQIIELIPGITGET